MLSREHRCRQTLHDAREKLRQCSVVFMVPPSLLQEECMHGPSFVTMDTPLYKDIYCDGTFLKNLPPALSGQVRHATASLLWM